MKEFKINKNQAGLLISAISELNSMSILELMKNGDFVNKETYEFYKKEYEIHGADFLFYLFEELVNFHNN